MSIPMVMTSQGNAAPVYAQLLNKVLDLKSKESNIPLAAITNTGAADGQYVCKPALLEPKW